MKKLLKESFTASLKNPETILWANGTTDMRFDIAGNEFKSRSGEAKKVNVASPLFFSGNIHFVLEYINSHISKDYGINSQSAEKDVARGSHGLVVFAQLAEGTRLFDFTDLADFNALAGTFKKFNMRSQPTAQDVKDIFDGCEVYFAFNTTVTNSKLHLVPIEFSAAQKMLVWKSSKSEEISQNFFINNSFSKKINELSEFTYQATQEDYKKFYEDYMKSLGSSTLGTSLYGRDQLKDEKGRIVKKLPETITDAQLKKINTYFKMFDLYIDNKKFIPPATLEKIRKSNSAEERDGQYMDFLQVVLHTLIFMSGFKGYYCPEYVSAKSNTNLKAGSTYSAIALFSRDCIKEYAAFSLANIQAAMANSEFEDNNDEHKVLDELLKLTRKLNKERAEQNKKNADQTFAQAMDKFDNMEQAQKRNAELYTVNSRYMVDVYNELEKIKPTDLYPNLPRIKAHLKKLEFHDKYIIAKVNSLKAKNSKIAESPAELVKRLSSEYMKTQSESNLPKYSKKQIIEAVKYWEKKLQDGNFS